MRKRPWWEEEFLSNEHNQKYIKWLEKQTIIEKHKEKENKIRNAFIHEINLKKDEINKIQIEIKQLERMCDECLAKISSGDTGLMELVAERNTKQ